MWAIEIVVGLVLALALFIGLKVIGFVIKIALFAAVVGFVAGVVGARMLRGGNRS
jgi:hypothetical protein